MRAIFRQSCCFLGLAVAGCADISGLDGKPSMNPGENCMTCHSATGQASARQWTVAGTVFTAPLTKTDAGLPNAEVLIQDSAKPPNALTLITDDVGNFYTGQSFTPPLHVAVQYQGQRYDMQESPPVGACNLCHNVTHQRDGGFLPVPLPVPYLDAGFDYGGAAPGRLFVPTEGVDGGGN